MDRWAALLLLFGTLTLWLLLVRWLGQRGMKPESTRKLFHSGSGAILLSLPLLFASDFLPVLIWGLVATLAMAVLLISPGLRERFAGNVYEVNRISYGDLYFVAGVVLLFFFAAQTYYTYAVPLTMLSFADALSAIIGKRFGRHKFEAVEGRKSIEGSLAFFSVAFIAVLAWSPALPNADPLHVTMIAVILGLVVMLLEAISWRGLDNLLIPLGGFLLLRTYLMMELPLLALNLAVVTLLVVFVIAWRRRTTLSDSALITGALFGYTAWTVAGALFSPGAWIGLLWLGPPLILFVLFNLRYAPELLEEHHEKHNVDAVFGAVFAGAVWLYLAFFFQRADFVFPFVVSFAAVALNMYFERSMHRAPRHRHKFAATAGGALAMLACGATALYASGITPSLRLALLLGAVALGGVLCAALLRLGAGAWLGEDAGHRWRWHIRGLAALLGSLVAALPLLANVSLPGQ